MNDRGRTRDFATSVAIHMTLATAGGALAVVLVLVLLSLALGPPVQPFDDAVLRALTDHRTERWDRVALHVTALGNTTTLAVLVSWVSLFLWLAGHPLRAIVLIVTAAGGRVLNELLKAMFDRARPEILDWGTHVTAASFPSAHAMSAAVVYGAMAYLAVSAPADAGAASRHATVWMAAVLLVLAVAASRVYLGVHYPSDVAAGILAGAIWTASLMTTLRAARDPEGA